MGMSIDKAIEHGKEQLEIFGGEHKEFIEIAISTMRKCQKIKKILDTNVVYSDSDFMKLSAIKRVVDGDMQEDKFWKFIDEVVEDGNDD
jgi:hypothetical protein